MNKKVSIIMATYNTEEKYLEEAIESILKQTYTNFEFIIICDGSQNDLKIIKKYTDSRIKLIVNKENIGLTRSLNKGLDYASGEYILRLDSDDVCIKNRIRKQVDFMEKNKRIEISGTYGYNIGETKGISKTITMFFKKPEELCIELLYKNILIHSSIIMRANIIKENNIRYDENFKCSQDYELWSRLAKQDNIGILRQKCIKRRLHKNQITKNKNKIQIECMNKAIIKNSLPKLGHDKKAENVLFNLIGREKISFEELEKMKKDLDNIIKNSSYYDKKILKKVLNVQFFHIILKSKFTALQWRFIIKNMNILNYNNLKYLLYHIKLMVLGKRR